MMSSSGNADTSDGSVTAKRYKKTTDDVTIGVTVSGGKTLHMAVAGCSHGEMDAIYGQLLQIEQRRNIKFDLLICCGDFQVCTFYIFLRMPLLVISKISKILHYENLDINLV